jgi:hypothetical protein
VSAETQNGHLITCQETSRLSQPVRTLHDLKLCKFIAVPTDKTYKENIQCDTNLTSDDIFLTDRRLGCSTNDNCRNKRTEVIKPEKNCITKNSQRYLRFSQLLMNIQESSRTYKICTNLTKSCRIRSEELITG